MPPKAQIVIPARLASTRLPEKLLRTAGGKSILQHTYENACRASVAEGVIVAVDNQRLADEVESFGGRWIMTSPACASGTDRIAEVAAAIGDVDIFINVQGDEPEVEPDVIDRVAMALMEDSSADMATAATPIRSSEILHDPSCVKVVIATKTGSRGHAGSLRADAAGVEGRAIYFSRASLPYCRDGSTDESLLAEPPLFWHHLGMYAYRRDFLSWFAGQPPGRLEQAEKLEQLRALEAGKKIVVVRTEGAAPGIDTAADLEAFRQRLENRKTGL